MNDIAFWKELNTRLPTVNNALHEFLKYNDGSGSIVKEREDQRNSITLFIERKKSGKKKPSREYIDPSIRELEFTNDNGSLGVSLDKKKVKLNWSGNIKCDERDTTVKCSVFGVGDSRVVLSDAKKKTRFRDKPKVEKILKKKSQTRDIITTETLDIWGEAKTNVRDINNLALFGSAGGAGIAGVTAYFLPAMGFLLLAAPMLVGATALANSETIVRNKKGEWYINGEFGDDKWINKIDVEPIHVKKVKIFQDDEFYQHFKVEFKKPLICTMKETSDAMSLYPERRLECIG